MKATLVVYASGAMDLSAHTNRDGYDYTTPRTGQQMAQSMAETDSYASDSSRVGLAILSIERGSIDCCEAHDIYALGRLIALMRLLED